MITLTKKRKIAIAVVIFTGLILYFLLPRMNAISKAKNYTPSEFKKQ